MLNFNKKRFFNFLLFLMFFQFKKVIGTWRRERRCWQTAAWFASTSSTKWAKWTGQRSTRSWSSRPSPSRRRAFTLRSTRGAAWWRRPIRSTVRFFLIFLIFCDLDDYFFGFFFLINFYSFFRCFKLKFDLFSQKNSKFLLKMIKNKKYDSDKSPQQNIPLPDSILSRFDVLFIVLDKLDPETVISKLYKTKHRKKFAKIFLNW